MRWLVLVPLLCGCYTPEAFEVDLDDAVCDWAADCFQSPDTLVGSYAYCEAPRPEPEPIETSCAFRHQKAKRCVGQVERMNCPDAAVPPPMPASCDEVWDCG